MVVTIDCTADRSVSRDVMINAAKSTARGVSANITNAQPTEQVTIAVMTGVDVNSRKSRSLLDAYPGDAVPVEEAASAGEVAELAKRYGYGEWSDDDEEDDADEEEDDHEDTHDDSRSESLVGSGGTRTRRRKKVRWKVVDVVGDNEGDTNSDDGDGGEKTTMTTTTTTKKMLMKSATMKMIAIAQ
jgi:hypothetical protein